MTQKGWILPVTLLMMLWISCCLLSHMHAMKIYLKIMTQQFETQAIWYDMEHGVEQLMAMSADSCVLHPIESDSEETITHQLKLGQGCIYRMHGRSYRYFLSDLGIYPCLLIHAGIRVSASHHWSISIMHADIPQYILSTRFASAEPTSISCDSDQTIDIMAGKMSSHRTM